MNCQAFRRKLELAIEERDPFALKQLEAIADQSPATAQMWQDHLLVEQAIQQWLVLSACEAHPSDETGSPAPAPIQRRRTSAATVLTTSLCLLCGAVLLGIVRFPTSPDSTAQISGSVTSAARPMADPSAENLTQHLSPLAQGVHSLQHSLQQEPLALETPAVDRSSRFLSYSVAWADRNRTIIPVMGILPVLPEMTSQLSQEMSETWQALSTFPLGMPEAWQRYYMPTSPSTPSPAPSPDEGTESQSPRLKTGRERPTHNFSQEALWSTSVEYLG